MTIPISCLTKMPSRIPTPTWRKLTDEELFRPLRVGPIDVDADQDEDRALSDFDCVSMNESPARIDRECTGYNGTRYTARGTNGKCTPILYPSPIQCWKLVKNAVARSSRTASFVDQLKDELNNAGYSRLAEAFQLKPGYKLDGRSN